jgi:hypothetical protein
MPTDSDVALNLLGRFHHKPLTRTLSGGDGIRTHGLYIANVALCQLSYTPDDRQVSQCEGRGGFDRSVPG